MALSLLSADSPSLAFALGSPQWGIFSQQGGPILVAESVESVEYARDYQISDYPQEKGAFQSYNKVQTPFHAKVSFLIAESRRAFLNSIEQTVGSLQLVSVFTPDVVYPAANLTHYGYRRTARNGKTLILVEVWCEEVRVVSGSPLFPAQQQGQADAGSTSSTPGDTQSPNGSDSSQSGQVQSIPQGPSGSENYATSNNDTQSNSTSPSFYAGDTSLQVPDRWNSLTEEQQNTIIQSGPAPTPEPPTPTPPTTIVVVPIPPGQVVPVPAAPGGVSDVTGTYFGTQ